MPRGLPERRARRLARNAQLVLAEETHLSYLGNPSATSEDLDILTASLCASAWDEFRHIEAEGGLFASLAAGQLQRRVAETREQRLAHLRAEALRIVGDTLHVPDEAPTVAVLAAERRTPSSEGAAFCEKLPAIRHDEMLARG